MNAQQLQHAHNERYMLERRIDAYTQQRRQRYTRMYDLLQTLNQHIDVSFTLYDVASNKMQTAMQQNDNARAIFHQTNMQNIYANIERLQRMVSAMNSVINIYTMYDNANDDANATNAYKRMYSVARDYKRFCK